MSEEHIDVELKEIEAIAGIQDPTIVDIVLQGAVPVSGYIWSKESNIIRPVAEDDRLFIDSTMASTSTVNGAVVIAGGLGVGGDINANNFRTYNVDTGGSDCILIGPDTGIGNTGTGNIAIGLDSLSGAYTGDASLALGVRALQHASTGTNNIAIGQNALRGASGTNEASENTAIGTASMSAVTTASYNVSIGRRTLERLTSGTYNMAMGFLSLGYVTTGGYNVAIGGRALTGLSTESHNIAIGYQAGGNVAGSGNMFLGDSAGYSQTAVSNTLWIHNGDADSDTTLIYGEFDNAILKLNAQTIISDTTASTSTVNGALVVAGGIASLDAINGNVIGTATHYEVAGERWIHEATISGDTFRSIAMGPRCLDSFVSGLGTQGGNMAVGYRCLEAVTTGIFNFAFGTEALMSGNPSGSTAIGFQACRAGSSFSIGIGDRAMYANTGNRNIAIGNLAMSAASTGTQNTVLGHNAGSVLQSSFNILIGYNAGMLMSTGNNNVSVGSLQSLTTGSANTTVGSGAMSLAVLSSNCVAIGASALRSGNGDYNTAVGAYASQFNLGQRNVSLGYQCGRLLDGDGNICIGYKAGRAARTLSNTLWIHNDDVDENNTLIYGEFDNALLRFNNAEDKALLKSHPTGAVALAIATTKYADDSHLSQWISLTTGFNTDPVLVQPAEDTPEAGEVWKYDYDGSVTRYRFITPDGSRDEFYETYDAEVLDILVATKRITL